MSILRDVGAGSRARTGASESTEPFLMSNTGRIFAWMLLAAACSWPGWAEAEDATPPLATIVERAMARVESTQKALQSMQYHQRLITERMDDHGRVTQRQELEMVVRPGAAQEIEVVSGKGDQLPAKPDKAALQTEGQKAQKQNLDFSLKDLVSRFRVTFAGTDTIEGQRVYVLAFEPKPDQPYRNLVENVLNHARGQVWVSARDYSILETDATLAEPVAIAWVFAQVHNLHFHYELKNTSGGFGPAQVVAFIRVTAPFVSINQRIMIDMTQFEPRTKP